MKLALALLALSGQALFYFMMIAFSVPGVDAGRKLETFLTASIYVLLGVCFVGAAVSCCNFWFCALSSFCVFRNCKNR